MSEMIRINMYIREDQEEALSKIPGTYSELIRQAIDDFIVKKTFQAGQSPSKKGASHGRTNI